jgi:regulator of protease activity HflC (stomatin/prohibitin superfamily)
MSWVAVVVLVVVGLPLLIFALWWVLQELRVSIESGSVALVLQRGVATEKVLQPGLHLLRPYKKRTMQIYPLRELTYLAGPGQQPEASDLQDEPLELHLGDRTAVAVSYTVRFRIRPEKLRDLHERVGPLGIKSVVRDRSRQVLMDRLGEAGTTYADLFGEARAALQTALSEQLGTALEGESLELVLFTLRDVDLGETGEMVQAAVRGRAELEREEAAAAVRLARVRNENEINTLLVGGLADEVIRYRQIELWREYVQRWDGHATPTVVSAGGTLGAAPGMAPGMPVARPPEADSAPPEPAP